MNNKAEHAVQSYAAGVGGLGLWAIFAICLSYHKATLPILEKMMGGKESIDD